MLRPSKFSFILLIGFLAFSCKKESEDCSVRIDIVEPTEGSIVSDPTSVGAEIEFTGQSGNVAEVTIRIFPETDPADLIIDNSTNPNTQIHVASYNMDLSIYPAGTRFRIETTACCGGITCEFTAQKNRAFQIP